MREADVVMGFTKSRVLLLEAGIDNEPGCYAVFNDEVCLYVGKSLKLLSRILTHACAVFGTPTLKVWLDENPDKLEQELILGLNPVNNVKLRPKPEYGRVRVDYSGSSRIGTILGESRDKTCWRVLLDGKSPTSTESFHKDYCSKL